MAVVVEIRRDSFMGQTNGVAAGSSVDRLHQRHADFWDTEFSRCSQVSWRMEKIAQLIPVLVPPGGSVLEVGCNVGLLARSLSGFQYTGLDLMVPPGSDLRILPYDINSLKPPPGPEMVDCVVMSGVIEYAMAPRILLSLLCARLKPGGHLLLSQMNFFFLSVLVRKAFNLDYEHFRTWNHTTDFRMLRQWLADEGVPIRQEITLDTCLTHLRPVARAWARRVRQGNPALPDVLTKQKLFVARKG